MTQRFEAMPSMARFTAPVPQRRRLPTPVVQLRERQPARRKIRRPSKLAPDSPWSWKVAASHVGKPPLRLTNADGVLQDPLRRLTCDQKPAATRGGVIARVWRSIRQK